jgi:hypothetical protein
MRALILLPLVLAGGCATTGAEPSKLKAPARYLMAPPCAMPSIPETEGNPAVRAGYYASSRACHGRTGDQVRGLQSYVRKVRGS